MRYFIICGDADYAWTQETNDSAPEGLCEHCRLVTIDDYKNHLADKYVHATIEAAEEFLAAMKEVGYDE